MWKHPNAIMLGNIRPEGWRERGWLGGVVAKPAEEWNLKWWEKIREKKLHESQNPIKIAYTIDKPKLNYSARQEIKTQLLFKTMKA